MIRTRPAEGGIRSRPIAETVSNEQGVTNQERTLINTLGTSPGAIIDWLRGRGYEAIQIDDDEYAVRKPGDTWKKVDPSGIGDWWKDLTIDAADEYASMAAMSKGAAVGAAAGTAVPGIGSVLGGFAGAGTGGAIAEAARRGAGIAAGFTDTPGEFAAETGKAAIGGLFGEAVGVAGKAGVRGAGKLIRGFQRGALTATTRTLGEMTDLARGMPRTARLKLAADLGVKDAFEKEGTGRLADEIAGLQFGKQGGAEGLSKLTKNQAKEFIGEGPKGQDPYDIDFSATRSDFHRRGGVFQKGQPPQTAESEFLSRLKQNPRPENARMLAERGLGDLSGKTDAEIAEYLATHQPGYVKGVGSYDPEKYDLARFHERKPEWDPSWRSLPLEGMHSISAGGRSLGMEAPNALGRLGRAVLGRPAPLANTILGPAGRVAGGLGKRVEQAGGFIRGLSAPVAIGGLMGHGGIQRTIIQSVGVEYGGKAIQAVGRLMMGDAGATAAKIAGAADAPYAMVKLAETAIKKLQAGNFDGYRATVFILANNPEFRSWLEAGETAEVGA